MDWSPDVPSPESTHDDKDRDFEPDFPHLSIDQHSSTERRFHDDEAHHNDDQHLRRQQPEHDTRRHVKLISARNKPKSMAKPTAQVGADPRATWWQVADAAPPTAEHHGHRKVLRFCRLKIAPLWQGPPHQTRRRRLVSTCRWAPAEAIERLVGAVGHPLFTLFNGGVLSEFQLAWHAGQLWVTIE